MGALRAGVCCFPFYTFHSTKPRYYPATMTLDAGSGTLVGLPQVLSRGLVAVSFFGLLSFICSSVLFLFLTWKIVSWRLKSGGDVPINQFLFLIYNLLFADIQQALAFLLNISHLRQDAIVVGDTTCWAQGWFVSTGDLASTRTSA